MQISLRLVVVCCSAILRLSFSLGQKKLVQPWSPPKPTFAATLFFKENTTEALAGGAKVMWWESRGVSVQDGGPFGYGWKVAEDNSLVPFAFYFGAFW